MGFSFGKLGETIRKVGGSIGREALSLGKGVAEKGIKVLKGALPVVGSVADAVIKGIKYATPVLGIVPELLPVAMALTAGAKAVKNATGIGTQLLGADNLEKAVGKLVKENPILVSKVMTAGKRLV
jgi:hypothetical protein